MWNQILRRELKLSERPYTPYTPYTPYNVLVADQLSVEQVGPSTPLTFYGIRSYAASSS